MTTAEQVDQVAEVEAIKQVVATVQHAQRNELPDEFLGLFREDAIWTTGGGKRLLGLEEIAAFTRQALPGGMKAKGLSVAMEVVHVLFIRPDVAAVKVRQQYSNLDGSSVDNQDIVFNEGTPLFVMSKEDDQWRLVACQNTEVAADS
ncbi:SgcJ/EcaC family oxidoreductase [Kribbella sp. NPDC051952]|uniref:SgcJ/EcaC family oxidoreductase n=1 Tax=Kribbella sp. NPDC051952 TaxID=3154851 RepID=UPI0034257FC1